MNVYDFLVIGAVAFCFLIALIKTVRKRKNGGCCGSCSGCSGCARACAKNKTD